MMMGRFLFTVAVLAGCTKADAEREAPAKAPASSEQAPAVAPKFATPPPAKTTPPTPTPTPTKAPPAKAQVGVELTAVTLADDCGGTAPYTAPDTKTKAKSALKSDAARGARAKRRCEQTSMQLAITSTAAASIKVKSVELFDDAGKSLGKLAPSKPTRWSLDQGRYETWDEMVPAGTPLNVSYVLQQPAWDRIGNRWNRTYTLKTVVTIGGVDRSAQKDVSLSAPTTLPPNVKT